MELSLFAKVCLLLFGSTFTTALGAYYGRLVRSMGGFIALIILFLAGAFAVFAAAHASAGLGIAVLYIWTFISGMLLSFSLEHYVETLGTKTVVFATGGTTLVMALCAIIGMFSGFNFGIIGPILSVVLIGLIGVGIVNIFVRFSKEVDIGYSIIGMLCFTGYFLFDFWRLSKSQNTWEAAIQLTMSIYLDFLNFLLDLLRLLEATKKD